MKKLHNCLDNPLVLTMPQKISREQYFVGREIRKDSLIQFPHTEGRVTL